MSQNLPAVRSGAEVASTWTVADATRVEEEALRGDHGPWAQAEVMADLWIKNPQFQPGTREQYRLIWKAWLKWCHMIEIPPFEIKRRNLDRYTDRLETVGNPTVDPSRQKPLSKRSVARHMAVISSFYNRAITEQVTELNPVPPKGRPKVNQESRQPLLTRDELRSLVAAADADSPRSSALVAMLVLACLRVSEALGSRVEDTSREAGSHFVWVTRKGGKGAKVLVPPEAWLRVSAAIAGRRSGPILVTAGGKPLDRVAAWKLIGRLGRDAGLSAEIGPHTLRHAYITRGHEMKLPVADLQQAAGHESVDTTRTYDRSHMKTDRHPSIFIARDLAGPADPESPDA